MIWVYLCTGIFVVGWLLQRLFFTPKRAAQNIAETGESLYSTTHEYAEVADAKKKFRDLDHGFYDRTQAELEAMGFRNLGDCENVTVNKTMPLMRTFLRRMASDDGKVMADMYHLKCRGWMRLLGWAGLLPSDQLYVDIETEFSNGTFLVTSNTGDTPTSGVPGIMDQLRPKTTTPAELVHEHRATLSASEAQGLEARLITTVAEIEAAQERMQELKNRHKKSQGFIDLELTKAIVNESPSEEGDRMVEELKVIQQQKMTATPMNPPPIPQTRRDDQKAA